MADPPVFVVGCPRSGTTLLYHMLVSTGAFANYRAETHLYDVLEPAVGPLDRRESRERLATRWPRHMSFRRFDLEDEDTIRRRIVEECRSGADVLSLLFGEMGERQGRSRWAECTPAHVLYMRRIRAELPEARFLHIIRDGRDVALSLRKVGWVHSPPWPSAPELIVGAWQWEWIVRRGRRIGRTLGDAYGEVRFEDLVRSPEETLDALSPFVEHELDYRRIIENPVGSVDRPNTAFGGGDDGDGFDPVGRWRRQCSDAELDALQATIGRTLDRLGYPRAGAGSPASSSPALTAQKRMYQAYRDLRLDVKRHTALSRWLTDFRPDET